jgi:hypothetical protein
MRRSRGRLSVQPLVFSKAYIGISYICQQA